VQNTGFSRKKTLNLNGRLMILDTPKVMGILNVTPDSFFDGGRFESEHAMLTQVEDMVRAGVDFVDVGGYSTRPGADEIPIDLEIQRTRTAIDAILRAFPEVFISIDTFRSEVARMAVGQGAVMVNDVSGGTLDSQMFQTVSGLKVPYILMHMRGTPSTMAQMTTYENLVKDITFDLQKKASELHQLDVADVIIDPGFGFAKTREQNFEILSRLDEFSVLGLPLLVGLSRKSMVWKTLKIEPDAALNGTTVLNTIALMKGANILRVHDVADCKQAIELVTQLDMGKINIHSR
jgi:dihydropteroate synthase